MNYLKSFFIVCALLLSGCVIETTTASDRDITCGNFDNFLYDCTSTCKPSWDCELNYDDLTLNDQLALDDCSDCLAGNPSCGDCAVPAEGISSCRTFMEDLLGVDCW